MNKIKFIHYRLIGVNCIRIFFFNLRFVESGIQALLKVHCTSVCVLCACMRTAPSVRGHLNVFVGVIHIRCGAHHTESEQKSVKTLNFYIFS